VKVELLKNVDLTLLQQLVQLEREAFGAGGLNEWHLVPFIRHGRIYVASEQQGAVGLIQYMRDWDNPRKAYLMGVSIAKEKRGQGLGTMLIRTSLQALKKENMEEVELTVNPDNRGAIKVYVEKLGFIAKCTRPDEYGAGENRLVMALSLRNFIQ
jgi:ribosomal-protein-alanine N-acetyltransferase